MPTPTPAIPARLAPSKGSVTWESEGTEGGKFHSRKLHVPTDQSGVTIGRGYDFKERLAGSAKGDLMKAGLTEDEAKKLAKAVTLKGKDARKFIADNELKDFEITEQVQLALFTITYDTLAADTRRLAGKDDVVTLYGATDWEKLHPAIKDVLIDLRFRGDYTGAAREKIQKSVAANDLTAFAKLLSDASNWKNVPKDRFERRNAFLAQAVKSDAAARPAKPGATVPTAAPVKPGAAPFRPGPPPHVVPLRLG